MLSVSCNKRTEIQQNMRLCPNPPCIHLTKNTINDCEKQHLCRRLALPTYLQQMNTESKSGILITKSAFQHFVHICALGGMLFKMKLQDKVVSKPSTSLGRALVLIPAKVIIHFILTHKIARKNFVTLARCEVSDPINTELSLG